MKRIILGIFLIPTLLHAQSDISLKDILSLKYGKLVMTPTFATDVLPYLKTSMSKTNADKTIHSKTYTLSKNMTLSEMVINYSIRIIDPSDGQSFLTSYQNGSFDNVTLSSTEANLTFVLCGNVGYVVNVYLSPQSKRWVLAAHAWDDAPAYKAGSRIITY